MSNKITFFILTVICFLVYFNCLNNALIIDDIPAILNNPQISRPLIYLLDPPRLFNSLGFLAGGVSPLPQHLISILLHAIATILVFLFLRKFFKFAPSFLSAVIFAVHPIHTEAVAWISGRSYVILAIFTIGAYLLYEKAISAGINKGKGVFYYFAALLMFSYYINLNVTFYFIFPFFLLISEIVFCKWKDDFKWWLPFLIIVFVKLFLASVEIPGRVEILASGLGFEAARNPLTYFIYSFYTHLSLLIWPVSLSMFHEPYIIPASMFDWRSILYILPVILFLVYLFKKEKALFLAAAIFIMFLLPTYSPVPVSSLVAERYLYLPSVGLCMAIAFLYEKSAVKFSFLKQLFFLLLVILIISFSLRTMIRNKDFKDLRTFWFATLKASPKSWNAASNVGYIYLEEGDFPRAAQELEQATRLNPRSAVTYNNLGIAYKGLGDYEAAISCFKRAIELNPAYPKANNNLLAVLEARRAKNQLPGG